MRVYARKHTNTQIHTHAHETHTYKGMGVKYHVSQPSRLPPDSLGFVVLSWKQGKEDTYPRGASFHVQSQIWQFVTGHCTCASSDIRYSVLHCASIKRPRSMHSASLPCIHTYTTTVCSFIWNCVSCCFVEKNNGSPEIFEDIQGNSTMGWGSLNF